MDSWDNEWYRLRLDNLQIFSNNYVESEASNNLCGGQWKDSRN
jgi:hypothetical protein